MRLLSDRRQILFGGLLTLGFAHCATCASAQDGQGEGCTLRSEQVDDYFSRTGQASAFQSGSEPIEPRSGNAQLDRALAQSLAMLSRTFNVLPGFAYYRDDDGANAKATSAVLLERTDGTVLFGLNLLRQLLSRPEHPDASIVAVCAHEFGHIVAFRNNLQQSLTQGQGPFRGEQFADWLAGYFAGRRKRERPSFPAVVFATTQQSFGGPVRGSHGTGPERGRAVEAGFAAAYYQRLDADAAIDAAYAYARNVI